MSDPPLLLCIVLLIWASFAYTLFGFWGVLGCIAIALMCYGVSAMR